ncbi:MAG: hypothetical protein QJR10_02185 [Bacillota bacterium]|nr:hypothetical protein [Bacillota bacterium]
MKTEQRTGFLGGPALTRPLYANPALSVTLRQRGTLFHPGGAL